MSNKKQQNNNGGTGYQAKQITVNNGTHVHGSTPRNKSVIAEVVNLLSALPQSEQTVFDSASLPAGVAEKIQHNSVAKCRYIIETYKSNTIDLENVYNTLEQERPGRKQKLLNRINFCYKQQLGQLVTGNNLDIQVIRQNSDTILENIVGILREKILESSNLNADNEDVDLAVNLIVADAFIQCLVLENPEAAE